MKVLYQYKRLLIFYMAVVDTKGVKYWCSSESAGDIRTKVVCPLVGQSGPSQVRVVVTTYWAQSRHKTLSVRRGAESTKNELNWTPITSDMIVLPLTLAPGGCFGSNVSAR